MATYVNKQGKEQTVLLQAETGSMGLDHYGIYGTFGNDSFGFKHVQGNQIKNIESLTKPKNDCANDLPVRDNAVIELTNKSHLKNRIEPPVKMI